MRPRFPRFPWPLVLAAVALVGVSATIVLQIYVLATPPSIAFPIEFGPTDSPGTYTVTVNVVSGDTVAYATIAGLGKLRLQTNTSGWYFDIAQHVGTAIVSHGNDAEFDVVGFRVFIKTNETHGVVAVKSPRGVYVTPAVKVRVGGWTVYHPVYSDLTRDTNMVNMITSILTRLNEPEAYVLQPRHDYLEVDSDFLYVYLDVVTAGGGVTIKGTIVLYTPNSLNTATVDVNGMLCTASHACFLSTVFAWYIDTPPTGSVNTALTVTAR